MNQQERDATLRGSLRALAKMESAMETPSRVEAAVMARWDAAHAPRSRPRRLVRGAAATAAGITLAGAMAWQRGAVPPEAPTPLDTVPNIAVPAAASPAERYTTVAVVGEPLQAHEPIRVVRMRVTRSVLGELGIPASAVPAETVDIDVLVGEDGVARGVRVPM
jgi:hypothetical protein